MGFPEPFFSTRRSWRRGYLLGRLPFSCGVSTHEQTMLFMSMGNLESATRLDCESLNCESGANEVRADSLLELLYCKITVWSTIFRNLTQPKCTPRVTQIPNGDGARCGGDKVHAQMCFSAEEGTCGAVGNVSPSIFKEVRPTD